MPVVTKGAYAAHRGVSPGRVSQWVAAGLLADALVGEGRAAQIDVERADAALRRSLDVAQVMGQGRTLPPPPAAAPVVAAAPAAPGPLLPVADDDAARMQRAKANSAEMTAERQRRELLEERGVYVRAAEARNAFSRALAGWVSATETFLATELATALAEAVSEAHAQGRVLDRRSLAILLRTRFAAFRTKKAEAAAEQAEAAAPLVADPPDLPEPLAAE